MWNCLFRKPGVASRPLRRAYLLAQPLHLTVTLGAPSAPLPERTGRTGPAWSSALHSRASCHVPGMCVEWTRGEMNEVINSEGESTDKCGQSQAGGF